MKTLAVFTMLPTMLALPATITTTMLRAVLPVLVIPLVPMMLTGVPDGPMSLGASLRDRDRDRGEPHGSTPPTPPCIRVRTRRFDGFKRLDGIGEKRGRAGRRRR